MNGGKRLLCTLLIVCCCANIWAQEQFAFRISFVDKAGSPSLSTPLQFLSQRALDRRAAQNITLETTDQPVSPLYIDTVLSLTGGILHVTSRWMNDCVVLLSDSANIGSIQGKAWIGSVQYIAHYSAGLHLRTSADRQEGSYATAKTTGTPSYYGRTWNQTELVHGDCLHDATLKGDGKIIAVLDDGYKFVDTNPGFDSLNNDGRIREVHNFVKASGVVYSDHSHGTQALSVMAAMIPDTFVSAAPHAQYALYITEDQGSEQPIEMDNLVAGLERADSLGADIVSASIGYNTFDFPFDDLTLADIDGKTTQAARGVNYASAKGILCVITAGNEGGNSWGKILTPGDADSALTIGNVDDSGVPAGNSGYGPNAAGIVKPDVVALGNPAVVLNSSTTPLGIPGTSFATPQIAGFAACLWQGHPSATASQLRRAIRATGSHFLNPGNQIGYGVPDFCEALQALDINDVETGPGQVMIYPNPATDLINILLAPSLENAQLKIIDISGRAVQSVMLSGGTSTISVSSLPAGVYVLKISGKREAVTRRLIKK